MEFARQLLEPLLNSAKQYPVLTVLGPRQSGKTTLVKSAFKDHTYLNLEDPSLREIASRDPKALLNPAKAGLSSGLIIDEVQYVPELLSYVQLLADQSGKNGQFILTGSHQLQLHAALSQSLAGRTAIMELLPLSIAELTNQGIQQKSNEWLLRGFYPRIYQKNLDATQVYRDYVKTYLERDLRQMINLKDLLVFQRFIKLCAGRIAGILNINTLANEVGVSNHTIKNWLSILQASYLIQLISPYYENFGKRVIKAPKLYFTDVGLACYLLEIENLAQIDRDPLRGQLFENMVVMELIKSRLNKARDANLYYWRDQQNYEIDLIYKRGAELIPIEIKSAQTFQYDFLKGINYFKKLVVERCGQPYLIYAGEEDINLKEAKIINYQHSAEITL